MDSLKTIYKSFNTIIEMLADRGITVDPPIMAEQLDSFIMNQTNKPGFDIVLLGKFRIVYYLANKFKWSEVKKFFEEERPFELTILVVKDKISQNNLKQISSLGIEMQIFLLKELQFNISKHQLVPKHELVTDQEEIRRIMDMYSLKSRTQFPLILRTDPMARWLNLQTGDIVKITRPSPTSGHYVVYRCCV